MAKTKQTARISTGGQNTALLQNLQKRASATRLAQTYMRSFFKEIGKDKPFLHAAEALAKREHRFHTVAIAPPVHDIALSVDLTPCMPAHASNGSESASNGLLIGPNALTGSLLPYRSTSLSPYLPSKNPSNDLAIKPATSEQANLFNRLAREALHEAETFAAMADRFNEALRSLVSENLSNLMGHRGFTAYLPGVNHSQHLVRKAAREARMYTAACEKEGLETDDECSADSDSDSYSSTTDKEDWTGTDYEDEYEREEKEYNEVEEALVHFGMTLQTSDQKNVFEAVLDKPTAKAAVRNTLVDCAASLRLKQHIFDLVAQAHISQAKRFQDPKLQGFALNKSYDEEKLKHLFSIAELLSDADNSARMLGLIH